MTALFRRLSKYYDNEILERPRYSDIIPVIALISGVSSAILFWAQRGSFWEDEIIAVTHGLQPFPSFFVEILRNDIHPFFYFFLLKLWSSVDFGSDSWVLASSLAGSLLTIAVISSVVFREHGGRAALWAATLFCLLPTFSWSAGSLRMYGLMPAIAVACWFTNRELLRTGRSRWVLAVVVLQLMQAYTHAIGFFFAAFFALAAVVEQRDKLNRRTVVLWGGAQLASLIGMVPVVGSALIRGTEPLAMPSLQSLLSLPAETAAVWGATPGMLVVGGVSFLFLLAFSLLDKAGRIPVLVIPCGALLVCMALSSMGKPMFKPPVFTANLTPFLAIGAAISIAKYRRPGLQLIAAAYAVAMAVALWTGDLNRHAAGNYQPAAQYLASNTRPGDVVVVPTNSVFWGIMRYAVSPRWGRPLAIMQMEDNEQWAKLKEKLGPRWVNRLGLTPVADYVDNEGVRYVIGTDISRHWHGAGRLWIVHRRNYEDRGQEKIALPEPVLQDSVRWFGGELSVGLYHCP